MALSIISPFTDILDGITTVKEALTTLDTHTHEINHYCMYADDVTQSVSVTQADTYTEIQGGFSDGGGLGFTFTSYYLTCTAPGTYLFNWSLTVRNSVSDRTIEAGIMVNSEIVASGKAATRTKENGVDYSVSGCGRVVLAENDEISLCIEDETGTCTITMTHGNLTIYKVG